MAYLLIALAALIHVYIFLMESILWGRPIINRVFGFSPERAEQNRLFAFNQGYYNLFLSIAALLGIFLSLTGHVIVGLTLVVYSSMSMLGASLVLLYSQPKLIRAVLIQGLPPLFGLVFLAIRFRSLIM